MKTIEELEALKVGLVHSHFLDSGAFTLWTKAAEYAKANDLDSPWPYYDTDEFWTYLGGYCDFIKEHKVGIDLYANVDAIPNPELTWRNQKWMEKQGLTPVPVIHYKTDLDWLRRYIEDGYDLIGLGGLVGSMGQESCQDWLDKCFDIICDTADRMPVCRVHGFGVTSYDLMLRYPWWSVDSTSWTKIGAFGGIMVPHKRQGQFVFTEQPYIIKASDESPDVKKGGRHILNVSPTWRRYIEEWLELIEIPLGKRDKNGEVLEYGVLTRHTERRAANLLFFEAMRQSLPKWPWPWRATTRPSFGLRWKSPKRRFWLPVTHKPKALTIYYSGSGARYSRPEILPEKKNLMLTYWDQQKKPNTRFAAILEVRKRRQSLKASRRRD